jgi:hypothetical protein
MKFPYSLPIVAVTRIGFKSDLLSIDGMMRADRYADNLDRFGFFGAFDAKYGPFVSIFQQDGGHAHTSQKAPDWFDERFDVIVD